MPGSDIEELEKCHPMNLHIKDNGASNGSVSLCLSKHKTASVKPPFGSHCCVKRTVAFYIVSVILNLALIITLLSLLVRARQPSPALPTCPEVSCPSGWVGYQGKCYYFANAEGNWTSSKKYCSSLNASLAMIDSKEEMDFMMRYKGIADYWIGLERINQTWTWINGTIFNGWFTVLGGGGCAFMNHYDIASSSCSNKEPWICSKPVVRTQSILSIR